MTTSDHGHDVLIIGAGIIGLTTAVTLAESGSRVLIRTSTPPEETTSAAAGALWGPWMVEPAAQAMQWAKYSLEAFSELARHPDTGVRWAAGRDVSNTDHEPPEWFQLLNDRRPCAQDELPPGYQYGHRYTAPLVDMPRHLAYLTGRLHTAGGAIHVTPVNSLAETLAPVVINCTGLGARTLVGDTDVYPIRGQHVLVDNPGLTEFLEVDTGDSPDLIAIYPHGKHAVLGGTAEPHTWNRTPEAATTASILQRCISIEPRLKNAKVTDVRVGLRPTRPQVRLDAEPGPAGNLLIHCYGHGGAGVSLAWGCAADVAALAHRRL